MSVYPQIEWIGWLALKNPGKLRPLLKSRKALDTAYYDAIKYRGDWVPDNISVYTNEANIIIDGERIFTVSINSIICGKHAGWYSTEFIVDEGEIALKWGIRIDERMYETYGLYKCHGNFIYPLPSLDNKQSVTLQEIRMDIDRVVYGRVVYMTMADDSDED